MMFSLNHASFAWHFKYNLFRTHGIFLVLIYFMPKLITCLTVMSDPFCFGILDASAVAPEEEHPEEAFEPPPAREWQPDDVL